MICDLCHEPLLPTDHRARGNYLNAHHECMLRAVLDGVGHHLDHEHWCVKNDDPDAGLSARQSAHGVAQMMRQGKIRWAR